MAQLLTQRVNTKEIDDYIKGVSKRAGSLRPFFVAASVVISKSTAANFRAGGRPKKWKPLTSFTMAGRRAGRTVASHGLGQNILQRTGRLFASVTRLRGDAMAVRTISRKSLTYGTNLPQAPLLNFGGTIRPKSTKYLAIPMPGVEGRPRQYNNTFVQMSKKGNKIIFQNLGDGKIRPLFWLRTSVTIPSREFLGFQKEDIEELSNLALAFMADPKGYAKLSARLKRTGGGSKK